MSGSTATAITSADTHATYTASAPAPITVNAPSCVTVALVSPIAFRTFWMQADSLGRSIPVSWTYTAPCSVSGSPASTKPSTTAIASILHAPLTSARPCSRSRSSESTIGRSAA